MEEPGAQWPSPSGWGSRGRTPQLHAATCYIFNTNAKTASPVHFPRHRACWPGSLPSSSKGQMHDTDRGLGLGEVDMGIEENGDVLVSCLQGNGERSAAILRTEGASQAGLLALPPHRRVTRWLAVGGSVPRAAGGTSPPPSLPEFWVPLSSRRLGDVEWAPAPSWGRQWASELGWGPGFLEDSVTSWHLVSKLVRCSS